LLNVQATSENDAFANKRAVAVTFAPDVCAGTRAGRGMAAGYTRSDGTYVAPHYRQTGDEQGKQLHGEAPLAPIGRIERKV